MPCFYEAIPSELNKGDIAAQYLATSVESVRIQLGIVNQLPTVSELTVIDTLQDTLSIS